MNERAELTGTLDDLSWEQETDWMTDRWEA